MPILRLTPNHSQAFYPKTRGKWKALSSWEAPEKGTGSRRRAAETSEDEKRPREVRVKKGYSWSENVGIIVKALVDGGKRALVDWVRDVRITNLVPRTFAQWYEIDPLHGRGDPATDY